MAFHAAAGIEHQNDKTLAFWVEIGVHRNVRAPLVGNPVGRVAHLQIFRCGTPPKKT
jgi:hypothetical protein